MSETPRYPQSRSRLSRIAENRVWAFYEATQDVWALIRDLADEDTPDMPTLHHVLDAPEVQAEPPLFMVTLDERQWLDAIGLMEVARRVLQQGPLSPEDQRPWLAVLDHDERALREDSEADDTAVAMSNLLHATKDGPLLGLDVLRPKRRWFGRTRAR